VEQIVWRNERRKLGDLKPWVKNPRCATDKQAQDLDQSLSRLRLVAPLIINIDNLIIGGHLRYQRLLAKYGKDHQVDVRVPSRKLTPAELAELNLRLNKNMGDWDPELLGKFDEEMLLDVGFSAKEMDDIFDLEKGLKNPDTVPSLKKSTSVRAGDVFILGQHRLMCGDSTSPEHFKVLMAGKKADLVFTDPPYNVNYKGTGKRTSEKIDNDHLPAAQFLAFSQKLFHNMAAVMRDGAVYYICSGWSSYPVFHQCLVAEGLYRAGVIIWVKNHTSMGWNDFRYKHEWILVGKKKSARVKSVPILYGWKKGKHYFRDTRDECDVWEVPRKHSGNMLHPTEKPVWLIEKALASSSERGWNVLDICGGSGSTIIACERLSRKAFVMEIDPKDVQVMIDRWEEFTGKKAVAERKSAGGRIQDGGRAH